MLERHGVELIGATLDAIRTAEDRELFRDAMQEAGLGMPGSAIAHSVEEARNVIADLGLPVVVRPAYTLGGRGGGVARNELEFERRSRHGLATSPISQILIDQYSRAGASSSSRSCATATTTSS